MLCALAFAATTANARLTEINTVAIEPTPRSGAMPHNGYRPFDPGAIHAAFPDFRITPLDEGLAKAKAGS